jgi:hypothetical protein
MASSKTLFLKYREDEYLEIPPPVREAYMTSHIYREDIGDFDQNIQDPVFANLYEKKKEATKNLDQREYELREERRKK